MKRTLLFSFFVLFLLILPNLSAKAQAPVGYKLVWADEFNTNKLDTKLWKYRIDANGTSYQRSENVALENGKLLINLKKEQFKNKEFTGGGLISKKPSTYGYFEVSAKLDGGKGWHEAFWTSWRSGFEDNNPNYNQMDKLEIDCFEHYGEYDQHYYTYGAIQWSPLKGNANRDYRTVTEDLSKTYNIFGFEFTPTYLNYYFNGKLVKTVDAQVLPRHEFYIWLSAIATTTHAASSGKVFFDYVRAYEIASADYKKRKPQFSAHLDSLRLPTKSAGKDLWIEAEDFLIKTNWTKELDENNIVLKGNTQRVAKRDSIDLLAITGIKIKDTGNYKLWVRARDYSIAPGTRKFKLVVNGKETPNEFGNHGKNGYAWQYGGEHNLAKTATVIIFDSSQNFARCDKILFTTDPNFIPVGIGAGSNVEHTLPL